MGLATLSPWFPGSQTTWSNFSLNADTGSRRAGMGTGLSPAYCRSSDWLSCWSQGLLRRTQLTGWLAACYTHSPSLGWWRKWGSRGGREGRDRELVLILFLLCKIGNKQACSSHYCGDGSSGLNCRQREGLHIHHNAFSYSKKKITKQTILRE